MRREEEKKRRKKIDNNTNYLGKIYAPGSAVSVLVL